MKSVYLSLLCLLVFSVFGMQVTAQNFTVNSTGDTHATNPLSSALDNTGNITLRSALEASTQMPGTHIVTIPAGISNISLTLGEISVGNEAAGNNITVNGPGKLSLTINQTTVNRVFNIGTGAITFVLSNLTLNYSGPVSTISGGGGAILAGGVNASTTLNNIAIKNFKIQSENGGAVSQSAAGVHNLTITNCDFNNNYAGGGGGAVYYFGNGSCTVSASKFNNNLTGPLGTNSGGGGGALSTSGTGNGGVYTVTYCTFTGNGVMNAAAQGGAILNTNGALTANFNRFVGNGAVTPALGKTIAQAGGASVQTTNADNNWWGQNAPLANDYVVLAAGGTITCTKWMQLKTTFSPSTICTNAISLVTASFLENSAGELITIPNAVAVFGLPVGFTNPVRGTFVIVDATIQTNGVARVVYTSLASFGQGSLNAVVDNMSFNDPAPAKGTVTINGAIISSATITQPNCAVSGGTIVINATGSSALEYSINGGVNYQGSNTFSGLAPGAYSIVVRASGTTCTTTYTGNPVTINTSPLSREINVKGNAVTIADGDITPGLPDHTDFGSVLVGGNVVRTYTIENSGTTNLTIPAGAISVTGGDAGVFTIGGITLPVTIPGGGSSTFTVTFAPSGTGLKATTVNILNDDCDESTYDFSIQGTGFTCGISGTATTTAVTCAGGNDGTATITLSGSGSGSPGTYIVDGGPVQPFVTNPFTINGLAAGNHTIVATVTDGGCSSGPILVNVGTAANLSAIITKTNLSACGGGPDGTITVTPAGGSGNYSFNWTGSTGPGGATPFIAGNTASIAGLNYGYYNVTVTDAQCGNLAINNIHIQFAFSVVVSSSGSNSSSCGNTGTIVLYGNAGVQPYTYSVDGINYQSGNIFSGLAAGTYTGYIKDASGCVGIKPNIQIAAAAAISVNPFVRNASSCSNDGSIEVYRTGGISPYVYSLDNINYQASNNFNGLAAGPYTVYVKDSKGCIGSQTAVVGQGAALSLTVLKTATSTCTNDGTIRVTVNGGLPPFTYSLNGGPYQVSNLFAGLAQGNYTVTARDFKGCTGNSNVSINLNTINVTATAVASSTCNSNDGTIQLFRTGGTGPYVYSINGSTYQSASTFTGLSQGMYDGYVKDSKTCIGVINGIIVGPGCPPGTVAGNMYTKGSTVRLLENAGAAIQLKAYPNPSTDAFTISLDGFTAGKLSVKVTDVLGRIVYRFEGIWKPVLRFGNTFRPGIYHVKVEQEDNKQTIKIIKE